MTQPHNQAEQNPQKILAMANQGIPLRQVELARLIRASGRRVSVNHLRKLEREAVEKVKEMLGGLDLAPLKTPPMRKRRRVLR